MALANLYNKMLGWLANDQSVPQTDVDDFLCHAFTVFKDAADGAAGTTSTIATFTMPFSGTLDQLRIGALGAVTGDNTNNANILVAYNDGAGGASTTIATYTTTVANGNWVSAQTKNADASIGTTARVPKGSQVTVSITKGGTGVVIPISTYTLRFRRTG